MLNRYKVRVIKKYDFELDGKTEQDIKEQVEYIMTQTKILDLPEVRKSTRIKIKKNHERRYLEDETNNQRSNILC